MKDDDKTKEQLIDELVKLRRRNAELETSEAKRKEAAEELKESEEQFRQFFEKAPEYCYIISSVHYQPTSWRELRIPM